MEYFSDALQLMALGVSVVFIFLILLILAIGFMSFIVQRYFPETQIQACSHSQTSSSNPPQQDIMLVAAVAAVHAYRNHHQKDK